MKNSILLILTLTLSACSGGNKNSAPTSDNQLQELGACSSTFTTELNAAEWSFKTL